MNQQEFFERYTYDLDLDHLGGGGFGKVFKAYDNVRDRWVALKIAEVKSGQEQLSLQNEVELSKHLPDHTNIAHYEACYRFRTPQGVFDYGVLQYYPAGNLSHLIKSNTLSHTIRESIARGILDGLGHLHKHNVVHRDLKSSNILMAQRANGEYVPKIADFGLSKQFSSTEQSFFSNSFAGGSLLYVAPEQLTGDQIRRNVDLWSYGIVLFELFTGRVPFYPEKSDIYSESGRKEIVSKIESGTLPHTFYTIPEPWQKLIRVCLTVDPKIRIGSVEEAQQILSSQQRQGIGQPQAVYRDETLVESKAAPIHEGGSKESEPKKRIPPWIWVIPLCLLAGGVLWWLFIPRYSSAYISDRAGEQPQPSSLDTISASGDQPRIEGSTNDEESQAWQKAQSTNTISSFNEYLRIYPSGSHRAEANAAIRQIQSNDIADQESKAWQKAQSNNTISSFNEYLRIYPSGSHSMNARDKIKQLETPDLPPAILALEKSMVFVEGGSFQMGCTSEQSGCDNDEYPVHTVKVNSYYINKFEVTQMQWRAMMGRDPEWSGNKGCDQCPVDGVSWNDIQDFIKILNRLTGKQYRLPTEAEWEFAARGGNKSVGYNFAGSDNLNSVAWHHENSGSKTHPVGQKNPNELGLYDMTGNVWEFVQDCWNENYIGAPANGSAWRTGNCSRAAIRGEYNNCSAKECRLSIRSRVGRDTRGSFEGGYIGFRLSRT